MREEFAICPILVKVMDDKELFSFSDLIRLFGLRRHQLDYALREFGPAPAISRRGAVRLWSREQLPAIREALARVRKPRPAVAA